MATYYVSDVAYNKPHTHIVVVCVHTTFPPTSTGTNWTRDQVLKALNQGDSFITIYRENGLWTLGKKIFPFTLNKVQYIRTISNNKEADNLENLPELILTK